MCVQEVNLQWARFAFVLATAVGVFPAASAKAEKYLCTVAPTSAEVFIAEAILFDVRHGIWATVFDKNIEDVYGQPIMAEVTEASAKRVQFAWRVKAQKIRFRTGTGGGIGWREKVNYYATLDNRTRSMRIRAKTASLGNASAEGKCVLKK